MADDADVIVVGGGLAGLVAATEIADAGKRVIVVEQEGEQSLAARPSGRSADCFWSTRRNSAGSASRTVLISRCRTGSVRPASTATKTSGRGAGRKPMSDSRRARNAAGCARWDTGFSRWSAGPSAAATTRGPRQFGAAVSYQLGHRSRRGRAVRAPRARSRGRAGSPFVPPPCRRADRDQWRRQRRRRLDPRARATSHAASRARGKSSAIFRCARRP